MEDAELGRGAPASVVCSEWWDQATDINIARVNMLQKMSNEQVICRRSPPPMAKSAASWLNACKENHRAANFLKPPMTNILTTVLRPAEWEVKTGMEGFNINPDQFIFSIDAALLQKNEGS